MRDSQASLKAELCHQLGIVIFQVSVSVAQRNANQVMEAAPSTTVPMDQVPPETNTSPAPSANGVKSPVEILQKIASDADVGGDPGEALDQIDDILARELALYASVREKNDFEKMRERWVQESSAFHEHEKTLENKQYSILAGMNPKNDNDWKEICEKVFGPICHIIKENDYAPKLRRLTGVRDLSTYENLFMWMSRSEQYLLRGTRGVNWVDPLFDANLKERKFHKVVPVGCGYEYAVILASREPTNKSSDQDPDRQPLWSLYTAHITSAQGRFMNHATIQEAQQIFASEDHTKIRELKAQTQVVYNKGGCGNFVRPDTAAVHGHYVSCVWTNQPHAESTFAQEALSARYEQARSQSAQVLENFIIESGKNPIAHIKNTNMDILRIYRLPRLSGDARDIIELDFPLDILTHYELLYPYFVFVCSNQYLFDIPWIPQLKDASNFISIKHMNDIRDFIVVVDLKNKVLVRAWDSPGRINCLSVYPTQNSTLDESIPLAQAKVIWNISASEDSPEHRATFESFLLGDSNNELGFNYLWRSAKEEVVLKSKTNLSFKSPPNEASVVIRRDHGGHTVQISPNNMSTLILANPPLYKTNEIYYGRDQNYIDRMIYANTCITLYPDYSITFGSIRAAEAKDALRPVSRFALSDLKDYGERAGKIRPPPVLCYYKAFWLSVERMAVLFQDGTLLVMKAMSEQELQKLKETTAQLRKQHEAKQKVKELAEKQKRQAVEDDLVKIVMEKEGGDKKTKKPAAASPPKKQKDPSAMDDS